MLAWECHNCAVPLLWELGLCTDIPRPSHTTEQGDGRWRASKTSWPQLKVPSSPIWVMFWGAKSSHSSENLWGALWGTGRLCMVSLGLRRPHPKVSERNFQFSVRSPHIFDFPQKLLSVEIPLRYQSPVYIFSSLSYLWKKWCKVKNEMEPITEKANKKKVHNNKRETLSKLGNL